ncbi:MAG: FAD-dependent oxidoreductase [Halioglobus sp.]
MKTLVLGAGIAGLSSAFAQQQRGDEVVILEAREGVALESSLGNGGLMTASLCEPWNQPGISKIMVSALFGGKNSMLRIHPKMLPSLAFWGLKFLRNSSQARFLEASEADFRLSTYSQEKTKQLIGEHDWDIKFQDNGMLQVFRDQAGLDHALSIHVEYARKFGLEYELLDKAATLAREPHLQHSSDDLVGGIIYPDGSRGECPLFCQQLADLLVSRGANLRTGVSVEKILVAKGRAVGVRTNQGEVKADRVIVAMGNHAPMALRTAGVKLPVRPVKGYAITVPVDAELPKTIMLDVGLHIGIIPIHHDNTLRIGGGAEFAGMDAVFHERYVEQSYGNVAKTLPHLVPYLKRDQQQTWCGMRSVTFDGKPFIGATGVENLFVNGGLGHLGWTQGMGAGHLLADLIAGTTPPIDPTPFRLDR